MLDSRPIADSENNPSIHPSIHQNQSRSARCMGRDPWSQLYPLGIGRAKSESGRRLEDKRVSQSRVYTDVLFSNEWTRRPIIVPSQAVFFPIRCLQTSFGVGLLLFLLLLRSIFVFFSHTAIVVR